MTHTVTLRHNAEMGHRLFHLPGKCQSLHGHSWWADVTIEADTLHPTDRTVIEFAEAKAFLRSWMDTYWDHGLVLGGDDPLVAGLADLGYSGKVMVLEPGQWPTVEYLAVYLATVLEEWCRDRNRSPQRGEAPALHVRSVRLSETATNAATWEADR